MKSAFAMQKGGTDAGNAVCGNQPNRAPAAHPFPISAPLPYAPNDLTRHPYPPPPLPLTHPPRLSLAGHVPIVR